MRPDLLGSVGRALAGRDPARGGEEFFRPATRPSSSDTKFRRLETVHGADLFQGARIENEPGGSGGEEKAERRSSSACAMPTLSTLAKQKFLKYD